MGIFVKKFDALQSYLLPQVQSLITYQIRYNAAPDVPTSVLHVHVQFILLPIFCPW